VTALTLVFSSVVPAVECDVFFLPKNNTKSSKEEVEISYQANLISMRRGLKTQKAAQPPSVEPHLLMQHVQQLT
jgi:hypothetical protein